MSISAGSTLEWWIYLDIDHLSPQIPTLMWWAYHIFFIVTSHSQAAKCTAFDLWPLPRMSWLWCVAPLPLPVLITAQSKGSSLARRGLCNKNARSPSITVPLLSCLFQWNLTPNSRQAFDQHRLGEAVVPVDLNCRWQATAVWSKLL